MDYKRCQLSVKDHMQYLAVSMVISGLIAWLFYHSVYGMCLIIPIGIICRGRYRKQLMEKRQAELVMQFKDGMQAVSAALLAGYSVENAWHEAEKELVKLHGKNALLAKEFHRMNAKLKVNQQIEHLLTDFAVRSGCEDILSFAEIFEFAKRSGGDFVKIIRATITKINQKIEVEREIEMLISGKKLEGKIMNVMPLFILAYLNLTSRDFLTVLYGSSWGKLLMSIALIVYVITIKLSEYIMDIRV